MPMMQFGIFVALFIAIALCFLLIPLWMKPKFVLQTDSSDLNVQLAQKKLAVLETDLENFVITQAQYESLKNELMLNLHQDLQKNDVHKIDDTKGRWLAIPLAVFVPLLALAIYSVKGDLRAFDDVAVKSELAQKPTAADINGMVEKLAQKMKDNPSDPQGWVMLSRSYKVLKRYPEAIDAMRKARAILGDEPETLLQLADVIAMSNGGTLIGEPSTLITKALELDANNDMGLWLNGLANAEAGKFNEAIVSWQKLQTHYQPEEDDFQEVQGLINQAKEALGQVATPMPEIKTESKTAVANGKSIRVSVALDDKFKTTANPEDVVFIYAQPAQGGKMPLAVVKKQVKDLPLEITLDDSMAMMPSMTISSVSNVQISARISKLGNAIAQAGEPIGKAQVSTLIDNVGVSVTINETVAQ
jgi:cytochrome c-type biogenesis protein CcmH